MIPNHYIPKPAKIIDYTEESADTFTIRVDYKCEHHPGQFMQVSIPGIGEAPISICSYSNKYLDLNIRKVGNVTEAVGKLKKGDTLLIRGPYGKGYPMKHLKGNSLIIIGGGCGFAPLKGIVEYAGKNRHDYKDVVLFLGFRSPNDVLFKKQMDLWKKNFTLNITVDKKPTNTCWDGKVGFVIDLLQNYQMDNQNKVAMICGPPMMMQKCIEILKQKGFNDDQIFLSAERLMNCAIGLCGHCMIHGKYTCLDGPVFRYDVIKGQENQ